jgi:DNA-binding transcriptional LysR family regulator
MTRMANPDWTDVRTFLEVARTGSLSAAARALGVRHTTVARRVAALEGALGVSLVLRRPDGVVLTEAATALLPVGTAAEHAMQAFADAARGGRRRVRLAVPSGFSALLAERIAAFHASVPDVRIDVASGSRPVDLTRSEADLALRIGLVADETLIAIRLCTAGWSLYASDRYLARRARPANQQDLAGHEIIGFHGQLANAPGAAWIAAHGAEASVVLRLEEMTEVLDAALAGAGLAVLPCILGDADPQMHRLGVDVIGHQPLSVVYRREIVRAPPIRAVLRFVKSVIKERRAAIEGWPMAAAD